MKCPICDFERDHSFTTRVLTRYKAEFYYCRQCGYLGAADPYWIEEAYSSAIATMDTGLVGRNISLARRCIPMVYALLREDRSSKPCLDFAGGSGLFTRLMRDAGYNYFWADEYSNNLFARGFEYEPDLGPWGVVSAFEVLEHAPDPLDLVRQALAQAPAAHFLFTTELFEGPPPEPGTWWYYAFETGQHVSFYQQRTLEEMASQLGLHFASFNGLHVFSHEAVTLRARLAAGTLRRLLLPWIRRRLSPRTFSDLELIRSRLQETD